MTGGRTIAPATYSIVCLILVLLTILTVGVSFIHLEGIWHIGVGLGIGLCKASLVVLFFMHVIISPRLTWSLIAVVCFWMGIFLVLTLTDYFSRGMIPYLPGH